MDQVVDQWTKHFGIPSREVSCTDELQCSTQFVIARDVITRAIACALYTFRFVSREAEQEEIVCPGLLAYLDIRSVQRTYGERAIKHELHVARARCFFAGGRDLF